MVSERVGKEQKSSGPMFFVEQELQFIYPKDFKNLPRMSEDDFAFQLDRVYHLFTKDIRI